MSILQPQIASLDALFAPAGFATLTSLAVIAWNIDLHIIGWNAAAERLFGWSAEEALRMTVEELVLPSRRNLPPSFQERVHTALLPAHAVYENITKQGHIVSCEWDNTFFRDDAEQVYAVVSLARDVTAQQQLERERERLRSIAAAANAGNDPDEILLLVRNAVMELGRFDRVGIWSRENGVLHGAWGTDEEGDLRDEHSLRLRYEELAPQHRLIWNSDIAYAIEWHHQARVHTGPLSTQKRYACCALALRAGKDLIGIIFADNLMTDAMLSESDVQMLLPFTQHIAVAVANARLLRQHQEMVERQRRLMEMATAINASLELDEVLRLLRNAVIEATDFDRAGVFLVEDDMIYGTYGTDETGQPCDAHHTVFPLSHWSSWLMEIERRQQRLYIQRKAFSLPDGTVRPDVWHASLPLYCGDELVGVLVVDNIVSGNPITVENIQPLLPFVEQAAVAIRNARLLSRLKLAQETLVRSERLRAVGELTAGVAHNINNILVAVLGYAEFIQMESDTPAIKEYARIIERAALDGADIARRMQQFARQTPQASNGIFDLAATIQEAVELGHPAWHSQAMARGALVRIECDLKPDVAVQGVASEIREVLMNLIKNAAEAMPAGGVITVHCDGHEAEAVIQVHDTGLGMDEATRQRIFEPFFTTKGVELGTGLGLSVSWGIIERHRGRIEVESAPGRGTTFTISLPRIAVEALPVKERERRALQGLRVLLVEDEAQVAQGLLKLLTSQGALATRTADAQEALDWLAAQANHCDLVLTDHGLGGMTGLELLTMVRLRYPHLRRVLLSGWGEDQLDGDVSAAELILTKPFQINTLTEAIARLKPRGPQQGR